MTEIDAQRVCPELRAICQARVLVAMCARARNQDAFIKSHLCQAAAHLEGSPCDTPAELVANPLDYPSDMPPMGRTETVCKLDSAMRRLREYAATLPTGNHHLDRAVEHCREATIAGGRSVEALRADLNRAAKLYDYATEQARLRNPFEDPQDS